MRRDSRFCAKSLRYNIFTNSAPYIHKAYNTLRYESRYPHYTCQH